MTDAERTVLETALRYHDADKGSDIVAAWLAFAEAVRVLRGEEKADE